MLMGGRQLITASSTNNLRPTPNHYRNMNRNHSILSKAWLCLGLGASIAAANAAPINGVVTFSGIALLDNANSALATQVSIIAPTVVGVAGSFSPAISIGNTPTVTSPLVLGATPATIWTLGGFTFTPTAPLVGGGGPNNTFAIGAVGIVDDGPGGFDPTPAVFALATTPTIGGLGSFASITAADGPGQPTVPEAGSTLMLLGGGLTALAGYRRLRV